VEVARPFLLRPGNEATQTRGSCEPMLYGENHFMLMACVMSVAEVNIRAVHSVFPLDDICEIPGVCRRKAL